jgi:hypothetical protein
MWDPPYRNPGFESAAGDVRSETPNGNDGTHDDAEDGAESQTEAERSRSPTTEPDTLRTVDVELIWTRFEMEGPWRSSSTDEGDDTTLSVFMVISWPVQELVDHTAEFDSAGQRLRTLIDLFDVLRGQKPVIASRSRIEDGRFVGWLSYVDVLTAHDAFLTLREALRVRGLTIKLYTRDERVPFAWYGKGHQPVMSESA